jgi:hypothetical protein
MADAVFRRLVVSLAPEGDGRLAETAIDLARSLHVRLALLVIQNELMLQAVALPFVHEIDPQGGAWRTIDPDSVLRHWTGATEPFVSRIAQQIKRAGVAGEVRVSRGAPSAELGAACEPGDLVLLIEPSDPLARIAQPYASDLAAAMSGTRDILFVPHGASPREGPIAAVSATGDDRCIAVASQIADLRGRRLSISRPQEGRRSAADIQHALDAALGSAREGLIVMTRRAFDIEPAQAFALAAARGAPLLLLHAEIALSTDTAPT